MTTQASKLCIQARVMNKFALLCFDVYACQGNGPLKCFTNHFQFHFFFFLTQNHRGHSFTRLWIETIDLLIGANGAAAASGYYFLFVSLAQREARRPDTACQFGCALMIPPINCPGLVRHLHSVYCSFCVPVTDIYRSACKENISIFAEGEPVTMAF